MRVRDGASRVFLEGGFEPAVGERRRHDPVYGPALFVVGAWAAEGGGAEGEAARGVPQFPVAEEEHVVGEVGADGGEVGDEGDVVRCEVGCGADAGESIGG